MSPPRFAGLVKCDFCDTRVEVHVKRCANHRLEFGPATNGKAGHSPPDEPARHRCRGPHGKGNCPTGALVPARSKRCTDCLLVLRDQPQKETNQ